MDVFELRLHSCEQSGWWIPGSSPVAVRDLFTGRRLGPGVVTASLPVIAAASHDQKYVAIATDDFAVHLCEVASGRVLAVKKHSLASRLVRFSPDNRLLLIVNHGSFVYLATVPGGHAATVALNHPSEVVDAAF